MLNYQNLRFLQLQLLQFLSSSPTAMSEDCLVTDQKCPQHFLKLSSSDVLVQTKKLLWWEVSVPCSPPWCGYQDIQYKLLCTELMKMFLWCLNTPDYFTVPPWGASAPCCFSSCADRQQGWPRTSGCWKPPLADLSSDMYLSECLCFKLLYWKPQLQFELFGTFWPLRGADLASLHVVVDIQMLTVCWIKKRAGKYLHIVSWVLT